MTTLATTYAMFARTLHVEGLDLAGKSTATAAISTRYPEANVRRNALTHENPVYGLADHLRRTGSASADLLGYLYAASLSHDLRHLPDPTEPAIQDSTVLLRSLAFNTAIGARRIVDCLCDFLPVHPRFGATVVLTADLTVRRERLEQRKRLAPDEVAADDLLIHTDPRMFLAMEQTLISYASTYFNALIIDTTALTPAEVEDRVARVAEIALAPVITAD